VAGRLDTTWQTSADRFVALRHSVQNAILAKMKESAAIAIATVRDDVERVLAIPYFTVDLVLLRWVAARRRDTTAGGT